MTVTILLAVALLLSVACLLLECTHRIAHRSDNAAMRALIENLSHVFETCPDKVTSVQNDRSGFADRALVKEEIDKIKIYLDHTTTELDALGREVSELQDLHIIREAKISAKRERSND